MDACGVKGGHAGVRRLAEDQRQLCAPEDHSVDLVPGPHPLDDLDETSTRLVGEAAPDQFVEVDLVDERPVGLVWPDELDARGLERSCEERAFGRRPGGDEPGSAEVGGSRRGDESVEDAEHRDRRSRRDPLERTVHHHRGDDRQPGARTGEPRDRGIEQTDRRVDVPRKQGVERRSTVEALEQDRRVAVGGPALAPALDQATVVVGRRLRSDTADDSQHPLRRHRPILNHGGTSTEAPGTPPARSLVVTLAWAPVAAGQGSDRGPASRARASPHAPGRTECARTS